MYTLYVNNNSLNFVERQNIHFSLYIIMLSFDVKPVKFPV